MLLLHGLGATSEVWDGVVAALGDRAWVAPDLPGHGGSHSLPQYTFTATAEAVADLVDPADTVIIGHSFGGVVGLHLASRPGVRAVVGLGSRSPGRLTSSPGPRRSLPGSPPGSTRVMRPWPAT